MASGAQKLDSPLELAVEWSMLALESQHAIWLRTMKLCVGGAGAEAEAQLMMTEKIDVAQSAVVSLLKGAMPVSIVRQYRSAVRKNLLRLSRS